MYRALMLDVDGTLSRYSTTQLPEMPTDVVIDAIQKVKGRGVFVGLATSRPLSKVEPLLKRLELNGLSILHNGSQIIDSCSRETVWKKPLSQVAVKKLFEIASQHQIQSYFSDFYQNVKIESLAQLQAKPVADLFFDGVNPGDMQLIEQICSQLSDVFIHRLSSRWEDKLELSFTHCEATKQSAIAEVAKRLGIEAESIVGVGDGYNDIPLLLACGLKVAMGNAVQELKELANYTAPSVDEDGLVDVIERFILA